MDKWLDEIFLDYNKYLVYINLSKKEREKVKPVKLTIRDFYNPCLITVQM